MEIKIFKLLKISSNFHVGFKFLKKFPKDRNYKLILRKLNFPKILAINIAMLLSYYLNKNRFKLYCHNEFNYLLELNTKEIQNFNNKKGPKILYLSGNKLIDKVVIEDNFKKIHSKYKELQSYIYDLKNKIHCVKDLDILLQLYGYSVKDITGVDDDNINNNINLVKERLLSKPFIFFNKYNDVKSYSLEEFHEISKDDSTFNYFEKLTILNNKHDLLILNDYEYAFFIYLDNNKIDYNDSNFKLFRRLYFLINFFNVKFFVATREHSQFISKFGMDLNNIYLIKRENTLHSTPDSKTLEIENENFEIVNLTDDLSKINLNVSDDIICMNIMKKLISKANFFYYSNHTFKMKQGLEILNLYFKDIPYYLYFTNLKSEINKKKLNEILEIFNKNLDKINDNFALVIVDNEKNPENALFKLFKNKNFILTESSLKNTKFEEKISHYEPTVTKKLKLKNINKDTLIELIEKIDIELSENYLFQKKILPENLGLLNHINYEYYMNSSTSKKVILILNKDEKFNRNSIKRFRKLSKLNSHLNFYQMYNTDSNMETLSKMYGIDFLKSFNTTPQIFIVNVENKNLPAIFSNDLFLKYNTTIENINEELNNILNK